MKKFLLSLAAVACMGYVQAETLTVDVNDATDLKGTHVDATTSAEHIQPLESMNLGGMSFTFSKGENKNNAPAYYWATATAADQNKTVRVYTGNTMTVAAPEGKKFTAISFAGSHGTAGKNPTVNAGTTTAESATAMTWAGDAATITFTYTANFRIRTMEVTLAEAGAPALKDAGLKFEAETAEAVLGTAFTAPALTKATDAAVAYSSSEAGVATVDAATGAVTLVGAGTTVITASAEATAEYMAGSASYTLTVTDPSAVYASALGEDFTFEAIVNPDVNIWNHDSRYGLKGSGYIGGKIVAAEAIAWSPVLDLTAKKNIKLNFKNACNQYKLNNVLIPVADFKGYAMVVVREVSDAAVVAEIKTVCEITAPEKFSWNFYDNDPVDLDAYAKGKQVQIGFKYVSTAEVAGTWEVQGISVSADAMSGLEVIEAESEGPVEYYNLQGVRVNEPTQGIYVRRQGGKTTKVVVR